MPQTMPTQPFGVNQVPVSRIALGCMGLAGTWNPAEVGPENTRRAIAAFEAALDAGITFYDHADIYGGTACESVFKDCLAAVPGSRDRIFIATKVGIRAGFYDHSPDYIRESLRGSLKRLGVEYVDLYQLHRPDPLSHPAETAQVLDELVREGLVKNVGVSNYYPHQTAALQKYLEAPIVSNQIAISLLRLDPIYEGAAGGRAQSGNATCDAGDGVLDQCEEMGITPLAYSPLGGGWLSGRREAPADNAPVARTLDALRELGPAYGGATPGQLAVAWLLKHPAGIIPLVGSNNAEHIREAAGAAAISLSREDWYKLWVAARGVRVP
ncbi:MAG: aldo/keto reductase [Armatimonadetes bacterium]|nr:aldo/keto reductase [Armatimonadota bacterium]